MAKKRLAGDEVEPALADKDNADDGGGQAESNKEEPALADKDGSDEGGGQAQSDNDLDEEVVVVEHPGYGVRCLQRRWGLGMPLHLAIHI